MKGPTVLISLLAIAALLMTACPQTGDSAAPGPTPEGDGMDMDRMFAFGEPGDPGEAERKVEVTMLDTLRFDPDAVEVEVGETITFVLTNEGEIDHEFLIGDKAYQEEHEAEMQEMADEGEGMHHEGMPNALDVAPGETKELTWKFTQEGEVLYGCHEPGHYEGGMVGTITVTD